MKKPQIYSAFQNILYKGDSQLNITVKTNTLHVSCKMQEYFFIYTLTKKISADVLFISRKEFACTRKFTDTALH